MRLYEGMFIIDNTVVSSDWDSLVKQVHDILKNRGSEIVHSEKWEERKFAYKIKDQKRGTYLLVYFNAPADSISLIKRDLQLSDNVLRILIIKTDKVKESKVEEKVEDVEKTEKVEKVEDVEDSKEKTVPVVSD